MPLLIAGLGLVTFTGFLGLGVGILRLFRLRFTSPLLQVAGALLGIEVAGLAIELAAFAGLATRGVLISIWAFIVAAGIPCAVLFARPLLPPGASFPRGWSRLPAILGICGLALSALVALAPSTRHDELFHHMLVPARILWDGGLVFYRLPWQAAVMPHLAYQIAQAPLHALGLPDAANVVSLCLGLSGAWYVWFLLTRSAGAGEWAWLWAPALTVGMYAVVLDTSAGPHSMGDLAIMTAFVLAVARKETAPGLSTRGYLVALSLLGAAMVSAKVIYAPLAVAAYLAGVAGLRKTGTPWKDILAATATASVPWIVFLLPVTIWTWRECGSPLGPLGAGLFGGTVCDESVRRAVEASRGINQEGLAHMAAYFGLYFCPLIWAGAAVFAARGVPAAKRLAAGGLVGVQLALVVLYLPQDARFLAGTAYGLMLFFALHAPGRIKRAAVGGKALAAVAAAALLPWLGAQGYYASQFARVALGLQDRQEFCLSKVALYEDFERLDALLPPEAVLLSEGLQLGAIYVPRPVYYHPLDLPRETRAFLVRVKGAGRRAAPPGYVLGRTVYENSEAVLTVFRTPWRRRIIAPLEVVEIKRANVESSRPPGSRPAGRRGESISTDTGQ